MSISRYQRHQCKDIPNFDILLAGFPCQPFSNAGKRKGVNDENGRGTLFAECERIIKAKIENGHRPQAFVLRMSEVFSLPKCLME